MEIQVLFSETVRLSASDLHLVVGYPPMVRIHGALIPFTNATPLTSADCERLIFSTLNDEQKKILTTNRELDYSLATPQGRYRANVYYQRNSLAACYRLIPQTIRSIDELGLPDICHKFVHQHQGLILVTGPTGHGKSTTLAAMIQEINSIRQTHIVTIEDPIEYMYPPGKSIISQREMHGDTHSWQLALRSVLREDPDIVLIGEMRDYETIQAALTIAETGHLVFATLHTNSASQTIDRIVGVFPEHQQPQVRLQLAATLEAVISQRLIPSVQGERTLITELMVGTPAIKSTVREGRTHLIDNVIQTSLESGMSLFEKSLLEKVQAGVISFETALAHAVRPDELSRLAAHQ